MKSGKVHSNNNYRHQSVEKKWRSTWLSNNTYTPNIVDAKKPFFNLMMFPYPSAEGLHVGSMYAFGGADVYGRFKRMRGYDVLEPIGLDGFGIHSENYAIKVGRHPKENAEITENNFYRQLSEIGNSYAWDYRLETYDPHYYKWTQWLFVELFKAGLAYRGSAMVNWCPSCKTVLADEQVEGGECERCGSEVERKEMSSWYFKITDYADRLLENIDGTVAMSSQQSVVGMNEPSKNNSVQESEIRDYDVKRYGLKWPESIKTAQRKWIGKKAGINITYEIKDSDQSITCFTTRPDTNFGATFIVLSPEYAQSILRMIPAKFKSEAEKYIKVSLNKSEQKRLEEGKKKTGVFTGLYAINNLNGYEMPIYIADFVLSGVGTGAVVGVPGHDKRDFEFAKEFNLPVKLVVHRNEDTYRSYLMGGKNIADMELENIGVSIIETKKSGARKLEVPQKSYKKYQELVKEKLEPGFWNEVVGDEIWFLFKDKNENIVEYVLDENNRTEISQKSSEYNNDPIEKTSNIICYLASNEWYQDYLIQENEGVMINSEFLDGLDIHEATVKMIDYLEEKGWGKRMYNYHLRDWLISRQRYWGPPIPMIYCKACAKGGKSWFTENKGTINNDINWDHVGWYPAEEFPVELPDIKDFKPKGDGTSPLSNAPADWKEVSCPSCGKKAERELDVSDTFLDSSWYFLAYPNLKTEEYKNGSQPFNREITEKWLPVSAYIGGAEHAVLHLLYARFITMVLKDLKYVSFEEPFPFLFGHGLIIKDGAKMSKSKGNVINPDDYIAKFGADALRCYLMFLGPYDSGGDFRDTGMEGMSRFMKRVWSLVTENGQTLLTETESSALESFLQKTIKKVTEDMEQFKYNTSLAAIMELVNYMRDLSRGREDRAKGVTLHSEVWDQAQISLIKLLAPFAPHMTEELWQRFQGSMDTLSHGSKKSKQSNNEALKPSDSIHYQPWPTFDSELIVDETATVAVQVQGKLRTTLEFSPVEARNEKLVIEAVKNDEIIAKWLEGKTIVKEIFIPGKLVNFVLK